MQVFGDLRLGVGVKVGVGMVKAGVGVGMRQGEAEIWVLQHVKGAGTTNKARPPLLLREGV